MMDTLTCAIHDRPVGRSRNASAGHFERQTKNASIIEIHYEFNDSLKVSDCAVDKVCHLHCYMMPFSNLIMVLSVNSHASPCQPPADEPFPFDLNGIFAAVQCMGSRGVRLLLKASALNPA